MSTDYGLSHDGVALMPLNVNDILHNRFQILETIGKGGFGIVYLAYDHCKSMKVAVKVQHKRVVLFHPYTMLHMENFALRLVGKKDGGFVEGFPRPYFFGYAKKNCEDRILVMDVLGSSLQKLFEMCNYQFSLATLLLIVDQMLDRIQRIHSKHLIHRDIKPENILIGLGPAANTLHLVDFGLSLIRRKEDVVEENTPEKSRHIGTTRFMSRRAHLRLKQAEKDDLESLVYVLGYLVNRGDLPWVRVTGEEEHAGVPRKTIEIEEERHKKICEMKENIAMEKLFHGCPFEFSLFGITVRELKVTEKPKYAEYKEMFRSLGKIVGVDYEARNFDWIQPLSLTGLDVAGPEPAIRSYY